MFKTKKDFEILVAKVNVQAQVLTEHKEFLKQQMLDVFHESSKSVHDTSYEVLKKERGRFMIRFTKVAAVLIFFLVILLFTFVFNRTPYRTVGKGVAFGQIMEKFNTVTSYHLEMWSEAGGPEYVWAKSPDKLYFEEVKDQKYSISNGPYGWTIDIPGKKAIKSLSPIYKRAQ